MLGHLPFVKELIKHKIDVMNFILDLNQHGFSAVHMASANGHIEVVTELLKVAGPRAVNLKGKDGKTPLHCACVKGKAEIVSRLLEECGDMRVAISEATVRRENSLHLAMKNNQFQVLEVLVEKIKMNNLFELLNSKDEEGNTALHLAAARRNRQAIELLLRCNISNPGVVQLNALNHSRLTALDVVLMFPCDSIYNDVEILKYSGAERGCFLNSNPPIIDQPSDVQQQTLALASSSGSSKRKNPSRGEIVNLEGYFQFHSEDSDPNQVRNDLLVVAVLVATATYAAGINPPGGVREDGPRQGEARLASNMGSFILFMFFNSLGFYISLNILTVLTGTYPLYTDLFVAILAMVATYATGMISMSPPGHPRTFFWVISTFMPIAVALVSLFVRKWCRQKRNRSLRHMRQRNLSETTSG